MKNRDFQFFFQFAKKRRRVRKPINEKKALGFPFEGKKVFFKVFYEIITKSNTKVGDKH